ncbi:hypothetical protein SAMN04487886_10328 [Clostridium sp. DSM 8431]|uniref:hypothetical protein n=1 Tax=Clostridium sp. DSM 8431 TaxID=1761781 RepID=UPI0008DEC9EA|nr:hypothetical protein [Clostridium sp. DSM 8431]SFU45616.1 hypothetical protein SAMN04487886_10328 [Clostridium sp. DSM 8431]
MPKNIGQINHKNTIIILKYSKEYFKKVEIEIISLLVGVTLITSTCASARAFSYYYASSQLCLECGYKNIVDMGLRILKFFNNEGKTVVIVTHDEKSYIIL